MAERPAAGPGADGDPAAHNEEARLANGGYNAGIAVLSYMIGGIAVWSLIGWGLDNLLDTRWLVLAGAFLGAAGGFYLSHMHNLTRNHTRVRSADPGRPPVPRTDPSDSPQLNESDQ